MPHSTMLRILCMRRNVFKSRYIITDAVRRAIRRQLPLKRWLVTHSSQEKQDHTWEGQAGLEQIECGESVGGSLACGFCGEDWAGMVSQPRTG